MDVCPSSTIIQEMKLYERSKTRLDHFWVRILSDFGKKGTHLLEFVKIILILSHGNAALERGLSVNADCIIENQRQESLIALRVVYNAVNVAGGITSLSIDKGMTHAARNAHFVICSDLITFFIRHKFLLSATVLDLMFLGKFEVDILDIYSKFSIYSMMSYILNCWHRSKHM